MWLVVNEVERLRQPAALIDELDRVLLDEVAPLHLGQHAESFEDEVRLRDERLADVEARELLALEEFDLAAALSDEGGRSRAGRPAANDDHVGFAWKRGGHGAFPNEWV